MYAVRDVSGGRWVYKPGVARSVGHDAEVLRLADLQGAELTNPGENPNQAVGTDLRYEARNVAASRLDTLLGLSVIVRSSVAPIPRRKFIGDTPSSEDEEKFSDFGLLMERIEGSNGRKFVEHPAFDAIISSPRIKKDLSDLAVVDAILGSLDRHAGNFMVEMEGDTYKGIKGIDNDFSILSADFDIAKLRGITAEERGVLACDQLNEIRKRPEFKNVVGATMGYTMVSMVTPLVADQPEVVQKRAAELAKAYETLVRKLGKEDHVNSDGHPTMLEGIIDLRRYLLDAGIDVDHPSVQFCSRCVMYLENAIPLVNARKSLEQELGDAHMGPASGRVAVNSVGLPPVADKALADRIRATDFREAMYRQLAPLLTEGELKSMNVRLETLVQHLNRLEQEGKLVTHWDRHPDLDTLLNDSRHSHWARLKEARAKA